MVTLNDYIEHLITYLGLPNTEKTKQKLKKKFERTLKDDLKIWDDAKTVKVAKTKAKIFKISELEKAYFLNQKYLVKTLGIDEKQYDQLKQYNDTLRNQEKTIVSKEEYERINKALIESTKKYNERYKISLEEQNNVMLKALFERFFTPLDVKRWENDKIIIDNFENSNNPMDELNIIQAQNRLNQKDGKAYYKEK